jgi:RNA polymerase sigma factor (sigma-70 family)
LRISLDFRGKGRWHTLLFQSLFVLLFQTVPLSKKRQRHFLFVQVSLHFVISQQLVYGGFVTSPLTHNPFPFSKKEGGISMKRQFKTPEKDRSTYIYYDAYGKETVQLRSDEDGITEAKISMLHEMDDAEVNDERQNDYSTPYRFDSYGAAGDGSAEKNIWLADESAFVETILIEAEDEAEFEIKMQKLREALKTLHPDQLKLITKVYYQNRSKKEIANDEGVTENAIINRLTRIYKRLEKCLKVFL